ncbi:hypothetical protein GCM10022393_14950 [Aquimarina addita]|uniref:Uncharacterized protein n=1 Tax=Aquimarina addita TaxID=870485 RepID=A0ABP7XFP4_9FLAO
MIVNRPQLSVFLFLGNFKLSRFMIGTKDTYPLFLCYLIIKKLYKMKISNQTLSKYKLEEKEILLS